MKRTVRRAAIVLAALTITTLGLAVPAQAAVAAPTALADCPSSYACLWVNTNYSGTRWQGMNANPTLPSSINNRSSSAYNHGVNCEVHWYEGSNYSGGQLNQPRGNSIPNLGPLLWGDLISSMNWC